MKTRRGQLLVASPRLRDPNFAKSVVLLVQDDKDGALGLILNRPLNTTVKEALAPVLGESVQVDAPLHLGGPCEGPLMVLHAREDDNGPSQVLPGVSFTTDREEIERLMDEPGPPLKFFAGYSGWGADQLNAEIDEGAWLLMPASAEHVFHQRLDLWSRLMAEITLGRWIDPKRIPDDPSVN